MAKKKKGLSVGKILYFMALILGVVSVAMIFLAAVKSKDVSLLGSTIEGKKLTGLQVAFGYSENNIACLAFSFMGLLPWVLALVGTVFTLFNSLGKKGSKVLDFISIALFIGAGVMLFLMPNFIVFAETISGVIFEAIEWQLAIGSIIAGICSILAGVLVLIKNFVKK